MEEKRPALSFFDRLDQLINQKHNQLKLRKKFGKIDINFRDVWNNTPLHKAVKRGDRELTRLLIKSGASVNHINDQGDTPLHVASRFRTVVSAYILLKHGSDINRKNNLGFTPLHEAIHAEIVTMAKWSKINYYDGIKTDANNEPLGYRVQSDYDIAGNEFLEYFPHNYHLPIGEIDNTVLVRILVEAGADVNQQTAEGWTPLHFAVQIGRTDIVDILLQNGASVTLTAQSLPARLLLQMPRKIRMLFRICYKVINDETTNVPTTGTTVLHEAAKLDITDIAKVILDKGADINAQNSQGKTALHIAVENFQYHMVIFLILNGANINIKDNYGHIPLENVFVLRDPSEFPFDFDFDLYLDYQRKLVKYIVLWQYHQEYLFMKNSTIQSWWDNYEDTIHKMKDCVFEGSNISLYTIIRHIFNNQLLAIYLTNNSVIQSLHCIDRYCAMFPAYKEVIEILPHKLKSAEERRSLLNKLILVYNRVLPQLPLEIILQICSYLNNSDLKKFVLALCDVS
ncbi:putative ankyrin repeat protein RF_0381 isoform X1 [Diabrotica virgifera virgifera]|uniref:PRANC domain-containing protein n=1 Tax=Diabrotica virgifera virgifera TaxID=50390 RepID=A0ABM5KDU2_DIAVI|nr:putative ankyrin repeat protein RF_0381 isoform X1 [Diabrotica virgifera virgifera]